MKNIDRIIEKFNTPDTCLVVSAWPQKAGNKEINHGVAWYTKLSLTEIAKKKGTKFVVLAEAGFDNTPELVERGKILVLRVFTPTHHSLYPAILRWLRVFNTIPHVFVHSEFGAGSGLLHYGLLLPFLALIRLTGKRITYVAHNVIADITFLQTHLGIDASPFVIDATNMLIHLHTLCIGKLVDRIVVLDEALKQRLEKILPATPIIASAIPVSPAKIISRAKAKKFLKIPAGHKVMLSFGFLSAYKGSDWLVNAFHVHAKTALGSKTTLIMAGGPAHSVKNRSHYQDYYLELNRAAEASPNIRITGFVPEKHISIYFAAADLVVLPYRGLMGSSGGLTHALAYKRPFLFSTAMQDIWKNRDVQKAADAARVDKSRLFFPLSSVGMHELLKIVHSATKRAKLTQVSRILSDERTIQYHSDKAYNQIYAPRSYAEQDKLTILQSLGLAST